MKLAYSWLKPWLELDSTPDQLAALLTSLGLEVEQIEGYAPVLEQVVVAQVIACAPHPAADRLKVAQVNDGTSQWQVVCGAPNCRMGIKVALARLGARLPSGVEIKKAKLRGVESFGMLCALDELGYSGECEGIYELPQQATLGTLAMEWINDPVFTLALTPDLGHALSVAGVARLLAAKIGVTIEQQPLKSLCPQSQLKTPHVTLETPDCLQYACMRLEKLQVQPSPYWLVQQLEKAGYRSVNNLVDVGNWIMLQTGRPVHFFDADRIKGGLEVRLSRRGEQLLRIDGVQQQLPEGALVVADEQGVVALAGVMGSKAHEVDLTTQNALLEVAVFEPRALRLSARAAGCHSESSRRFERGVDADASESVFAQIIDLLEQIGTKPDYSAISWSGQRSFDAKRVTLRVKRAEQLLGIELSAERCAELLTRLGLQVDVEALLVHCTIPSYRHDLKIEEDLIDELIKLLGTQQLSAHQSRYRLFHRPSDLTYTFVQKVRRALVGQGLQEVLSLDLVDAQRLQAWGLDGFLRVKNPPSSEGGALRPNLFASLSQLLVHNRAQQIHDLALFEVGSVYGEGPEKETIALGLCLSGGYPQLRWDGSTRSYDLYDLKGIIETLFNSLGIEGLAQHEGAQHPWLHPRQQARWSDHQGLVMGHMGTIHPRLLSQLDFPQPIYYAEFSIKDLLQAQRALCHYRSLPSYPSSSRDWTLTLPESLEYGQLAAAIPQLESLASFELVGVWRSPQLGRERKNLTLRFHYRNQQRTLTQAEVEAHHAALQQHVIVKLGLDPHSIG